MDQRTRNGSKTPNKSPSAGLRHSTNRVARPVEGQHFSSQIELQKALLDFCDAELARETLKKNFGYKLTALDLVEVAPYYGFGQEFGEPICFASTPESIRVALRDHAKKLQSTCLLIHTPGHWTSCLLFGNFAVYANSFNTGIPVKFEDAIKEEGYVFRDVSRRQQIDDEENCGFWCFENARCIRVLMCSSTDTPCQTIARLKLPLLAVKDQEKFFKLQRVWLSQQLQPELEWDSFQLPKEVSQNLEDLSALIKAAAMEGAQEFCFMALQLEEKLRDAKKQILEALDGFNSKEKVREEVLRVFCELNTNVLRNNVEGRSVGDDNRTAHEVPPMQWLQFFYAQEMASAVITSGDRPQNDGREHGPCRQMRIEHVTQTTRSSNQSDRGRATHTNIPTNNVDEISDGVNNLMSHDTDINNEEQVPSPPQIHICEVHTESTSTISRSSTLKRRQQDDGRGNRSSKRMRTEDRTGSQASQSNDRSSRGSGQAREPMNRQSGSTAEFTTPWEYRKWEIQVVLDDLAANDVRLARMRRSEKIRNLWVKMIRLVNQAARDHGEEPFRLKNNLAQKIKSVVNLPVEELVAEFGEHTRKLHQLWAKRDHRHPISRNNNPLPTPPTSYPDIQRKIRGKIRRG